jgi:hypothetical protein
MSGSEILILIQVNFVSEAYHLLAHILPIALDLHKDVIWNKIALLKISLFADGY